MEKQSVAYGQSAVMPQEPDRDDYRFDGWDTAYDYIVADIRITATYVRQYTVKFVDHDNSIIEIQLIDHGADAAQPADPTRKNHVFTGWNTSFTSVYSNLTVKAQYIRQYTVTFIDYDGTILATEVVNSGGNATPPSDPTRVGYTFISWNQSYNSVLSNLEIIAVYEINRYTVTFVNPDGSVLATIENVAHGKTVTPPAPLDMYFDWSKTQGYRFTGWKGWNESSQIVGNTTITADYSEKINTPIIAIETIKIAKGTTTAEASVYLSGTFDCIYGISLKLHYAEPLVLNNGSITVNSKLSDAETTLHDDAKQFDLSWADGQGISVSERLAVLTLKFNVDKYTTAGEYTMELLDGTYIIDEHLTKITPMIVIGRIVVTE